MKMKLLKKIAAAALLLLMAALPASAEKRFHILMINDPHSYILPYREAVTDAEAARRSLTLAEWPARSRSCGMNAPG